MKKPIDVTTAGLRMVRCRLTSMLFVPVVNVSDFLVADIQTACFSELSDLLGATRHLENSLLSFSALSQIRRRTDLRAGNAAESLINYYQRAIPVVVKPFRLVISPRTTTTTNRGAGFVQTVQVIDDRIGDVVFRL